MIRRICAFVLLISLTTLVGHGHVSSLAPAGGPSPSIISAELPFAVEAADAEAGHAAGGRCGPVTRDLAGGDCTVDVLGTGGISTIERMQRGDSWMAVAVKLATEAFSPELRPPIPGS